jgi:hypothetical protein
LHKKLAGDPRMGSTSEAGDPRMGSTSKAGDPRMGSTSKAGAQITTAMMAPC